MVLPRSIPNSEDWKLHFHFAENEYFTNSVLTKTYRMTKQNEWSTDLEYTKVESTTIEWKAGKDVTVEKVQAKKVPRARERLSVCLSVSRHAVGKTWGQCGAVVNVRCEAGPGLGSSTLGLSSHRVT